MGVGAVAMVGAQASSPPPADGSWYVNSSSPSVAQSVGSSHGAYDKASHANSMDILDFGCQTSTGSETVNGIYLTNSQVEQIAEAYAQGYYTGAGGASATTYDDIIIGTNNSCSPTTAQGTTWANVVSAVTSVAESNTYGLRAIFNGGSDIESWSSSSYSGVAPGPAQNWLNGYSQGTAALMVNYGSADGCPSAGASNVACATTTNKLWYVYNYWYDSWGNPVAVAAPEIMGTGQAAEWANISHYGVDGQSADGMILFEGPLSETYIPGTLSSNSAYNDFEGSLSANQSAQTMPYLMDMKSMTAVAF
jgi:hypothetical protein